jgi:hypothetical protein
MHECNVQLALAVQLVSAATADSAQAHSECIGVHSDTSYIECTFLILWRTLLLHRALRTRYSFCF